MKAEQEEMRMRRSKALMRGNRLQRIDDLMPWLKVAAQNTHSKVKCTTVQYKSGYNDGVHAGRQAMAQEMMEKMNDT